MYNCYFTYVDMRSYSVTLLCGKGRMYDLQLLCSLIMCTCYFCLPRSRRKHLIRNSDTL